MLAWLKKIILHWFHIRLLNQLDLDNHTFIPLIWIELNWTLTGPTSCYFIISLMKRESFQTFFVVSRNIWDAGLLFFSHKSFLLINRRRDSHKEYVNRTYNYCSLTDGIWQMPKPSLIAVYGPSRKSIKRFYLSLFCKHLLLVIQSRGRKSWSSKRALKRELVKALVFHQFRMTH